LTISDEKLQACVELMKTVLKDTQGEIFFANTISMMDESVNRFIGQIYPLHNNQDEKVAQVFFFSALDIENKDHRTVHTIESESRLGDEASLEIQARLPEIELMYKHSLNVAMKLLDTSPRCDFTDKEIEDFLANNPM
jgi:hypothetical protein